MKKNVYVVTSSRAEYGILSSLLKGIAAAQDMQLHLVVTGTHLDPAFGNTQNEILSDGLTIAHRIPLKTDIRSKEDMAAVTGEAIRTFGAFFAEHRPDLLLILGDRYEIFAVAAAAAMHNIPIAHLHGGETTEGAVDEFLRHSITKMSTLHFTACEDYRRRVIQLGESPERVFCVGSLSVENIKRIPLLSLEELGASLDITLEPRKYCVVTYHPVTLENNTAQDQVMDLIRAMERFPQYHYIITKSNADAGGAEVNRIWDEQQLLHDNWTVVTSLGARRYFSALQNAAAVIGNSSSGILEGPAMHLPTVNIGDRQKGRLMAESVLSCSCDTDSVAAAMETAFSDRFYCLAKNARNPFEGTDIVNTILSHIRSFFARDDYTGKKVFYDLR